MIVALPGLFSYLFWEARRRLTCTNDDQNYIEINRKVVLN